MSAKKTPDLGGIPELPVAQSTPPPAQGNPFVQTGTQDHSFHTQFVFDINKQVAKLETGLEYIEKRLEKVEVKIDQIQIDLTSLKTTSGHIEKLMGTIVKALWAIAGSLGVAGLGIFTFWLKHKMGW